MRLNILANAPWGTTAYSAIARLFGPRLQRAGHDVSMTALWGLQGGIVEWAGIPVYPKGTALLADDVQAAHAAHWRSDVFLSWCDAFVIRPDRLTMPWSPWFPVDADPISPHLAPLLGKAKWPLVYSRWGLERLQDAGIEHARYVPVGVETEVFRPKDKTEARRALGLPTDRYIVGLVQANINGDRKALPQQIRGFAEFRRTHPDTLLYLHMYKWDHLKGIDLTPLVESVGLVPGEDVVFAHQHSYVTGLYGDDSMVNLYNAFDVLLSVTRAEGFGVPIVEAAACGTPAIVGDWSAMAELNFSGMAHPAEDATRAWNNFDTWWWLPREDVIADLLAQAYRTDWSNHRWGLRQEALEYDVDAVLRDYWLPVLGEMESTVERVTV